MPRLTETRRLDRRAQIASAAMRCVAQRGFSGTSMADIIKESGLSAGSIYSHYANKAELIYSVAADVLATRTRDLKPEASPSDFLRTILRSIDTDQAKMLLQVWAEVSRDKELFSVMQENLSVIQGLISTMLRFNQSAGIDPRLSVDAVMVAMQGFIVRLAIDPGVDPDSLLADIAVLLEDK